MLTSVKRRIAQNVMFDRMHRPLRAAVSRYTFGWSDITVPEPIDINSTNRLEKRIKKELTRC